MPSEWSRWADAMRSELAAMDDREALSWAAGCLRAAHVARLRTLYLLDSPVIRAAGALLLTLRAFDVVLPTLMTGANRLGALATTGRLGRATPGDDYQRLVPLMEAIPIWLHLLAILAGCAYLAAIWRLLRRHRSAGGALLVGVAVELAVTLLGRSLAADVGVIVVSNPSILSTVVLPVVLPLILAAAAVTGSRRGDVRAALFALIVAGAASAAGGSVAAQAPTFEVADVRASQAPVTQPMRGGVPRAGRYELRNATLVDLIRTAYNVDADKVLGGPTWLELDRFDVIARVPTAATRESVQPMLQALLADRFGLVARRDSMSVPGTALTLAGGTHKLRPGSGGPADCQTQQLQPGAPVLTATCRNTSMAALADLLTQVGRGVFVGRVVDATGLQGTWDFELSWTPPAALPQAGAAGIPIAAAIAQQLGLQTQQRDVSATGVVVDRVNRTPTPNAAGVEARIPAAPPVEFEVAQIRPSIEGAAPSTRLMPNGQIVAVANSIKTLISVGWEVSDPSLIIGPEWLDTARFDLVARLSSAPVAPQVDNDAIREMMRALLVQRFRIKWHSEERRLPALALTASGPHRLTPADPAVRTRCFDGPLPGARDPRAANPALSRVTTCQNMSMEEFAERLQGIGWGGYVQAPVADATGIGGRWTFTLAFSPLGMLQARPNMARPATGVTDGVPAAGEPNGALSLQEAVDRQLGLKLERRERPVPVLVIDEISRQPAE